MGSGRRVARIPAGQNHARIARQTPSRAGRPALEALEGRILLSSGPVAWEHLSSATGDLPAPNAGSQQTACLVLDVDRDGVDDFVIAERSQTPSVVWYRREVDGWTKYPIDNGVLPVEAGGAFYDIDGDNDLDIVFGGDYNSSQIWWWENPYPYYQPGAVWTRRTLKSSGATKHHDQAFGDVDGDGQVELVSWNQNANALLLIEIPADPRNFTGEWSRTTIAAAPNGSYEGLAIADIDGDGKDDIVGAGRWYRHTSGTAFQEYVIDTGRELTRSAVGQLVPGGRPEVVVSPGDGTGPLVWYQWNGTQWDEHVLDADVVYCHSLALGDIDGDGRLDIFAAEMGSPGAAAGATAWVYYGDGAGSFTQQVLAVGVGNHESKVGDLDGDGDLDILTKPYSYDAPRVDVWLNDGTNVIWDFSQIVIDPQPLSVPTMQIGDGDVADIDGDGHLDLWFCGVNGDEGLYQMHWYRGPDWQRFDINVGEWLSGAWGDVDADGDLDLVVAKDYGTATMVWLENTGDPTQPDWPEHPICTGLFEADNTMLADLNHDGRLDIVVHAHRQDVYYLPGPDDPFAPWTAYHIAHSDTYRTSGTLGDIDRDGDLDVLWGNGWLEAPDDLTATPWPNHTIDAAWPEEAQGVVADMNGDGRPDVVLSGEEGDTGVALYLAPADPKTGPWTKRVVISGGLYYGIHSLQVADFDGDGDLDIFAAEMHQGGDPDKVAVWENVDLLANVWKEHVVGTTGSHKAQVADLDGDGDPDIVGKNWSNAQYPLTIDAWINNINTRLSLDNWQRHVVDYSRPWRAVFITSADIDRDGLNDIVTGAWWYRNPGDVSSVWTRHELGAPLKNMAAVYDFDLDGDLDVLGTQGEGSNPSDDFVWARNDGGGGFTVLSNIESGNGDFLQGVAVGRFDAGGPLEVALSWHSLGTDQMLTVGADASLDTWAWRVISNTSQGEQLAAGDIDRDGDLDLLLGTQWLRNDGATWTAFPLSSTSGSPDRNRLADVNGDGRLDAVVGFEAISVIGKLVWYEQPADPTALWIEHTISTTTVGPMSLDVGDLDHDGDLDVVVGEHNLANPAAARLLIFENCDRAGTQWEPHVVYTGDEHHDGAQLVDIDGDGDLDIISIGWGSSKVVLYENRATRSTGYGHEPPTVHAGPDATLSRPAVAQLHGAASDDGLPYGTLTLQWTKVSGPGTVTFDHPGAAGTLVEFSLPGRYVLKLTANDGQLSSHDEVTIDVYNRSDRVTDGLTALYTFDEGAGSVVHDVSGVGSAMDLTIADPSAVTWLDGALSVDASTVISTAGAATKLIDAVVASNAVTVEVWMRPANVTQFGPARVVTVSGGPFLRNITIAQGQWSTYPPDVVEGRLRTTTTSDNGIPSILTPAGSITTNLMHVVYTRDADGNARLYVNNAVIVSDTVNGDLSNWDPTYPFVLANEPTGDRPWLGALRLVAVYDRALSPAEVAQNYLPGPDQRDNLPPQAVAETTFEADQALTLSVPVEQGLLANDSDPDSGPQALEAVLVNGPAHGQLALSGDGSFQYTPVPTYSGNDSFTYRARDGEDYSNLVTVPIWVYVHLPPTVLAWQTNDGAETPSRLTSLAVQFSRDVSASLGTNDLWLRNEATGIYVVPPSGSQQYDHGTNTVRWDLSAVSIASGYYSLTLVASGILDEARFRLDGNGDGSGGDNYRTGFLVAKAGDADLDGRVGYEDYKAILINFGRTDTTWSQADFDYDGDTDYEDYKKIIMNFGTYADIPGEEALSAPGSEAVAPTPEAIGATDLRTELWPASPAALLDGQSPPPATPPTCLPIAQPGPLTLLAPQIPRLSDLADLLAPEANPPADDLPAAPAPTADLLALLQPPDLHVPLGA